MLITEAAHLCLLLGFLTINIDVFLNLSAVSMRFAFTISTARHSSRSQPPFKAGPIRQYPILLSGQRWITSLDPNLTREVSERGHSSDHRHDEWSEHQSMLSVDNIYFRHTPFPSF